LHLFCARNRENELTVYDAATAKEQHHYTCDSPVRFTAFQPAAKTLLVLTADQKVHTMSLAAVSESTTRVAGPLK
jgi:hypothetical protein